MDVLEIAKERRTALEREIARLSEFIEMGEQLSSSGRIDGDSASAAKSGSNGGAQASGGGANTIRQFSSGKSA